MPIYRDYKKTINFYKEREQNLFKSPVSLMWQLKKLFLANEIEIFNEILLRHDFKESIDVLQQDEGRKVEFIRSLITKLHPKFGVVSEEAFFAFNVIEKLNSNFDQLLAEKLTPYLNQASLGFTLLDSTIDTLRLASQPNINNLKEVMFDMSYLYGMYYGINSYTLSINGLDIIEKLYQGEYTQMLKQTGTICSYMAMPILISYTGLPYLNLLYRASMTIYSGYNALSNLYDFYQNYNSQEFEVKSLEAYKDLTMSLSNSFVGYCYDLKPAVKAYELRINDAKLTIEKEVLANKLSEKGEFGQKLYEHIYSKMLEEKYELLNQLIEETITTKEAEALKMKNIILSIEGQEYDDCISINEKNNDISTEYGEHYYCYNDDDQILDHIILGADRMVGMIERL